MAVDRLATSIFDFYPDSPNYGLQNTAGAQQEAFTRMSDRNNEAALKEAELRAKISALQTASQVNQMDNRSSDRLFSDIGSAFLAPTMAYMGTMGSGNISPTLDGLSPTAYNDFTPPNISDYGGWEQDFSSFGFGISP